MPRSLLHVLLAASLALSAVASADPKKGDKLEAKTAYESGIKEFGDGKYDDAARDFGRSYELVGEPAILYNVAQSYRLAQRFGNAAKAYREFLAHLPPDAKSRPEVEGRIVEMDERVADEQRRAERARIEPPREAPIAHVVEPPPAKRIGTLEIVGYSLVGVTAAGLASGIALSVLAGKASSDVQHAASAHETFGTSLDDTQSRGKTYDKVAIAMYAVAGVAAAGAGVALGLGLAKHRSDRVAVLPAVTPQGAALVIGGHF
ncbi:MAG: hypothetical protein ABI321_08480 [Polyangia bacterium]